MDNDMPIPASEDELTHLFARLGAPEPGSWARSQVREGIPQLMRLLFLKSAWNEVNRDGDTSWIAREVSDSNAEPATPYAGLGLGLDQCLKQGVDPLVLNEMMRCAQAQMIFRMGYLLDDAYFGNLDERDDFEDLDDVSWGLFQTDDEGRPIGPAIGGLHESVLSLDPTGREMRPPRALLDMAAPKAP